MTHEQIIEKVRKLLALAASSNEHEAAAAAAKAERLMQEHRLSAAELEAAMTPAESAQQDAEPLFRVTKALPTWKRHLVASLCRLHGCHAVTRGVPGKPKNLWLFGRSSDLASVRYLYAWLTATIERLARSNGQGLGRAWANSYRIGAAVGVVAAMDAAAAAVRTQASSSSAIVRLDARVEEARQLSDLRAAEEGLGIDKGCYGKIRVRPDAYLKGESDGRAIHTGANLPAGAGARLLGAG